MTKIYQGHNCRRQALKPTWRLRLEERTITADFGEEVYLSLVDVHPNCLPSCYNWRIADGGGVLLEEFGTTVRYLVPDLNERCANSAVVEVWCRGKELDTAYITTTAFATPPHVLKWYAENRTLPTPAFDYWKYKAYNVRSYALYNTTIVDGKRVYVPAGAVSWPNKKGLFMISKMYDCNGILLSIQHFASFTVNTSEELYKKALEELKKAPVCRDMRTPFLKGEPVTLDPGAVIPSGWKPNGRRVVGLNVPYGTIWPADWKKGDPLPRWECCPVRLLIEGLL